MCIVCSPLVYDIVCHSCTAAQLLPCTIGRLARQGVGVGQLDDASTMRSADACVFRDPYMGKRPAAWTALILSPSFVQTAV